MLRKLFQISAAAWSFWGPALSQPTAPPSPPKLWGWVGGFGSADTTPQNHMGPLILAAQGPGMWFQSARWADPHRTPHRLQVTALCLGSHDPHGPRLLIAQVDTWRVSAAMANRVYKRLIEKHPHGGPTTLWLVPTQSPSTPDLTGAASRWPWSPGIHAPYLAFTEAQTVQALSQAIYMRGPVQLSLSTYKNPFSPGYLPDTPPFETHVLHVKDSQGAPLGNVAYGWFPTGQPKNTPIRRIAVGLPALVRKKMAHHFGGPWQMVLQAPGPQKKATWHQRGDLRTLFLNTKATPSPAFTPPLELESHSWAPPQRPLWWPIAQKLDLVEPMPKGWSHRLTLAHIGPLTLVALPGPVGPDVAGQLSPIKPNKPLWLLGAVNDWALEFHSPRALALGETPLSERLLRQKSRVKAIEDLAKLTAGDDRP